MLPAIRFKLLFGPYRMPRCRIGGFLICRRLGRVKVIGISAAPIAWPVARRQGAGGMPSLIMCGSLVRAVEQESETAVAHHWGVSIQTVWAWRKSLGVGPHTIGTRLLHRAWMPERFDDDARARTIAAAKRRSTKGFHTSHWSIATAAPDPPAALSGSVQATHSAREAGNAVLLYDLCVHHRGRRNNGPQSLHPAIPLRS